MPKSGSRGRRAGAAVASTTSLPSPPIRLRRLRGAFSAGVARTFQVTGRGGVPANAIAVSGNLTVTGQTAAGYVYLGPLPTPSPSSSTLNFPLGDDRANAVTVALSPTGSLSATYAAAAGSTQLVFDVTGYFVPDGSGATYVALSPARLLDTRVGNGLSGAFSAGVARTFQVTGRGGVPANAIAVSGNLTVTGQTAAGYVYLGPLPTPSPSSSTLNFPLGDDRANAVTVALSPTGSLSATYAAAAGSTQLVFDVTGYFVPDGSGATYVALSPARLLDTRVGNGLSGAFSAGVARTFHVTGRGGVPANAIAVSGNLTVTGQTAAGYVYLGPLPTPSPSSSTLNFPLGDDRANAVTVALSPTGSLSATYAAAAGSTQLVFDVTGYFVPDGSGATYVALSPARLLDTRVGNGLSGAFSAGVARTFQVTGRGGVPANAIAVSGNLTVTGQTAAGYVYLGPLPTPSPSSSTLNFPLGDDRANAVTVALSPTGSLSATYAAAAGSTQLVFDVTGYFVPDGSGATYVALSPARLLDTRVGNGLSGAFSAGVA